MGEKIPPTSGKDLIKMLSKIGIVHQRQRGSHVQLKGFHNGEQRVTTVPVHGKKLPIGTLLDILSDCGITRDEFLKLVKK